MTIFNSNDFWFLCLSLPYLVVSLSAHFSLSVSLSLYFLPVSLFISLSAFVCLSLSLSLSLFGSRWSFHRQPLLPAADPRPLHHPPGTPGPLLWLLEALGNDAAATPSGWLSLSLSLSLSLCLCLCLSFFISRSLFVSVSPFYLIIYACLFLFIPLFRLSLHWLGFQHQRWYRLKWYTGYLILSYFIKPACLCNFVDLINSLFMLVGVVFDIMNEKTWGVIDTTFAYLIL